MTHPSWLHGRHSPCQTCACRRLLLYPLGNKVPDVFAAYLEAPEAAFTPMAMIPEATFSLNLINQADRSRPPYSKGAACACLLGVSCCSLCLSARQDPPYSLPVITSHLICRPTSLTRGPSLSQKRRTDSPQPQLTGDSHHFLASRSSLTLSTAGMWMMRSRSG